MRRMLIVGLLVLGSTMAANTSWDEGFSEFFRLRVTLGEDIVAAIPTVAALSVDLEAQTLTIHDLFVFSDIFVQWLEGGSISESPPVLAIIRPPDPIHTSPLGLLLSGSKVLEFEVQSAEGFSGFPDVLHCKVEIGYESIEGIGPMSAILEVYGIPPFSRD